ncbi:DinB/UmuC family translesion DNA polymerase [Streptomyces sp. NPDC001076]
MVSRALQETDACGDHRGRSRALAVQVLLHATCRPGRPTPGESQIASRLTLAVRYADRSSTTRSRTLPDLTNHSPALVGLGQIRSGVGMSRWQVGQVARRVCSLRTTW